LFESHKIQCPTKNNEYHVKIDKTIKEACELLKDGLNTTLKNTTKAEMSPKNANNCDNLLKHNETHKLEVFIVKVCRAVAQLGRASEPA